MMKNNIGIKAILGLIAACLVLMAAVNTYSEDTKTTKTKPK
jgi:hypothetical protein